MNFKRQSAALLAAGLTLSMVAPLAAMADSYSSSTTTTTSSSSSSQQAMIPAGTALTVRSNGAVPTNVGDTFTGTLRSPVVMNGQTILPIGSTVKGEVIAINPATSATQIQMRDISTPSGTDVPIQSKVTFTQNAPIATDVNGNPTIQGSVYNYIPNPTFGPRRTTVAGRMAASALGGAVFGGATGTLVGVIEPGVYNMNFHQGTAALRGLAWGSAVGAGLGLVTDGVYELATAHNNNATVTNASTSYVAPSTTSTATNITTGSLVETPVSTTTNVNGSAINSSVLNGSADFVMTLDSPATVSW